MIVIGHDRAILNNLYRKAGVVPISDVTGTVPENQLPSSISDHQSLENRELAACHAQYALLEALPVSQLITATASLNTGSGVWETIPGLDFSASTVDGDVVLIFMTAHVGISVTSVAKIEINLLVDGVGGQDECIWQSSESVPVINPMSMVWRIQLDAGTHQLKLQAKRTGSPVLVWQNGTRVLAMLIKG